MKNPIGVPTPRILKPQQDFPVGQQVTTVTQNISPQVGRQGIHATGISIGANSSAQTTYPIAMTNALGVEATAILRGTYWVAPPTIINFDGKKVNWGVRGGLNNGEVCFLVVGSN